LKSVSVRIDVTIPANGWQMLRNDRRRSSFRGLETGQAPGAVWTSYRTRGSSRWVSTATLAGQIVLADELRSGTEEHSANLKRPKIEQIVLATGDRREIAEGD
jgi:cation transport ATPase